MSYNTGNSPFERSHYPDDEGLDRGYRQSTHYNPQPGEATPVSPEYRSTVEVPTPLFHSDSPSTRPLRPQTPPLTPPRGAMRSPTPDVPPLPPDYRYGTPNAIPSGKKSRPTTTFPGGFTVGKVTDLPTDLATYIKERRKEREQNEKRENKRSGFSFWKCLKLIWRMFNACWRGYKRFLNVIVLIQIIIFIGLIGGGIWIGFHPGKVANWIGGQVKEAIEKKLHELEDLAKDKVTEMVNLGKKEVKAIEEKAQKGMDQIHDKAEKEFKELIEKLKKGTDKVEGKKDEVKDKVEDKAEQAKDKLGKVGKMFGGKKGKRRAEPGDDIVDAVEYIAKLVEKQEEQFVTVDITVTTPSPATPAAVATSAIADVTLSTMEETTFETSYVKGSQVE